MPAPCDTLYNTPSLYGEGWGAAIPPCREGCGGASDAGFHGWLHPWDASADDIVMCTLVALLALMLIVLPACRQSIALQIESVFAPSGSRRGLDCAHMQDTTAARLLLWFSTTVLATSLAVCTIYICSMVYHPSSVSPIPMVILSPLGRLLPTPLYLRFTTACTLAASTLIWLLLLWFKRFAAGLVGWTFFTHEATHQWQCVYRLAVTLAATGYTAATLLMVCNSLSLTASTALCLLALLPTAFVTTWGVWRLFFGKLIGCLHFLLYLCTLELLSTLAAAAIQATTILPL